MAIQYTTPAAVVESSFVQPMATIPAPMRAPERLYRPFTDAGWLMEVKYDGWRCLAQVDGGAVALRTKARNDCTRSFPEVVECLARLADGLHIIDGEVCVLGEFGVSDFNAFHEWRAGRTKVPSGAPPVTFCAFDLLLFDGQDITGWPLEQRKTLLQLLLLDAELMDPEPAEGRPRFPCNVLLVDDVPADVETFRLLATLPIEGVVAKRRDSKYLPGVRSESWKKVKRPGWQEGRRWRDDRG